MEAAAASNRGRHLWSFIFSAFKF